MRQGVVKGIVSVFAVALLWAPGALAATPDDIYRDLADNGRLDGTYTQAEMQAFLQSASVQGYGNPVVVPPVVLVTPPTSNPTPPPAVQVPAPVQQPPAAELPAVTPTAGVAGTTKTIVAKAARPVASVAGAATPSQAPLERTASAETLPFTGAELGLFAIVGAALLAGGLLLRSSARQR